MNFNGKSKKQLNGNANLERVFCSIAGSEFMLRLLNVKRWNNLCTKLVNGTLYKRGDFK